MEKIIIGGLFLVACLGLISALGWIIWQVVKSNLELGRDLTHPKPEELLPHLQQFNVLTPSVCVTVNGKDVYIQRVTMLGYNAEPLRALWIQTNVPLKEGTRQELRRVRLVGGKRIITYKTILLPFPKNGELVNVCG